MLVSTALSRQQTSHFRRSSPHRLVHSLHTRCRSATASSSSALSRELADLTSWLQDHGVQGIGGADSKAAFHTYAESERGIVATRDIAEGETIFAVPTATTIECVCGGLDDPAQEHWSTLARVAEHVLRHMHDAESPWRPYILALPHYGTPFLPTWDDVIHTGIPLGELCPTLRTRLQMRDRILEQVSASLSKQVDGVTQQEAIWAMQIALSRVIGYQQMHRTVYVLEPLIDMMNHRGREFDTIPGSGMHAWDNVSTSRPVATHTHVVAKASIAAGQELHFFYPDSRQGNEAVLHTWGFVPRSNADEPVDLFVSRLAARTWCEQQEGWLHRAARVLQDPSHQLPHSTGSGSAPPSGAAGGSFRPDLTIKVMADGSMQRTLVNLFNEAATWEDQPNMRRKAESGSIWVSQAQLQAALSPAAKLLALKRCWELLHINSEPLLANLAWLARQSAGEDRAIYECMFEQQQQVVEAVHSNRLVQSLFPSVRETAATSGQQEPHTRALSPLTHMVTVLVATKKLVLWSAVQALLSGLDVPTDQQRLGSLHEQPTTKQSSSQPQLVA